MNTLIRSMHLVVISFVISTVTIAAIAAGPPRYEATFLGEGGVIEMNESGTAVGVASTNGQQAWVADPTFRLLPVPEGMQSSVANDINDLGEIVGAVGPYYSVEFGGHAVLWTPDGEGGYTVEILNGLPGEAASLATALNNLGDIVGFSSDGTYRHAVLFQRNGNAFDLNDTGVFDPVDVNDQRMMVDSSFTVKRLNLNTMIVEDLGKPQGSYIATAASAINERNQVAGAAILSNGGNCILVAALYTDGIGWQILSTCGSGNGVYDINDRGDLVMGLNVTSSVRFEGIGTFDIESLIDASVGHWYVFKYLGLAINNSRLMVVGATNPQTGQTGAVLLTPAYSLTVTNLSGGSNAVFNIAGATPMGKQYIVYSLRGFGSTWVPQLNVMLDLKKPKLLDSGFADASGMYETVINIPLKATGHTVWFQGAEYNSTTPAFSDTVQ